MKKRAFDIIHQNPFHIPENINMPEQAFRIRVAFSIVSIIACLAVMISSAFALFRSEVSTDNSSLLGAYYSIIVDKAENGTYICPSEPEDKHYFEISAAGTATTGYCKIQVGDDVYYTQRIVNGEPILITVQAVKDTVITFTPQWGPMQNRNIIQAGDEIYHSSTPIPQELKQSGSNEKTDEFFEVTEGDNAQSENLSDIQSEVTPIEENSDSETLLSDLDETELTDSETEFSNLDGTDEESPDELIPEGSFGDFDEEPQLSDDIENTESDTTTELEGCSDIAEDVGESAE